MEIDSKLLVKDANSSKRVFTFSIITVIFFIYLFLLVFYFKLGKNIYVVLITFVLLLGIIILWWKFPRKCSMDSLPMKYTKTESNLTYYKAIYKCPNGHFLEKKYVGRGAFHPKN